MTAHNRVLVNRKHDNWWNLIWMKQGSWHKGELNYFQEFHINDSGFTLQCAVMIIIFQIFLKFQDKLKLPFYWHWLGLLWFMHHRSRATWYNIIEATIRNKPVQFHLTDATRPDLEDQNLSSSSQNRKMGNLCKRLFGVFTSLWLIADMAFDILQIIEYSGEECLQERGEKDCNW